MRPRLGLVGMRMEMTRSYNDTHVARQHPFPVKEKYFLCHRFPCRASRVGLPSRVFKFQALVAYNTVR